MGSLHKYGPAKLLDPANEQLTGQARVNAEIFTAVEIMGRKLERVEAERDRLAQRLALIESSAMVDERTGKLYLPALVTPQTSPRGASAPRWLISTTLMSSAIALLALGVVMFRTPGPTLTKEQLAALDSLSGPQFTKLTAESGWKDIAAAPEVVTPPAAAPAPAPEVAQTPPAPLPDTTELAQLEQTAEAPKAVEAPAPAPAVQPEPPKPAAKVAKAEKKPAPAPAAAEDTSFENDGGMAPDPALPAKLAGLQKRAYEGVPEAQHDLATLYAAGTLVPQDYHRASYWFAKAADGGVANANYNMGVIYHQGLGVTRDMTKALKWYEKAAELGHPEAMYNLGIAYVEGTGIKTDVNKGVSYFKRAAKAGVAQAAYNLGVLYESNFIGAIDTKKAAEWYQVAAKKNHAEAKAALLRLQQDGIAAASAINMNDTPDDAGDQALSIADKVEPAADAGEEAGEGDASPIAENPRYKAVVTDIQRVLIKRGLLAPGKDNGRLSPETEDAIRTFQRNARMTVDGQPSAELLEKLLNAPPI